MISLALGVFVQCFEWQKPLEDVEMEFTASLRMTLIKAKPLEAVESSSSSSITTLMNSTCLL